MIYLDTHVLIYLYQGDLSLLSKKAIETIETHPIVVSGFTVLELSYLFEIGRISTPAKIIMDELLGHLRLKMCKLSATDIAVKAIEFSWTRDPFDRLIVANAAYANSPLMTKDRLIRANYPQSIWD